MPPDGRDRNNRRKLPVTTMIQGRKTKGFALILVMILMAMAVMVGLSYLAVASIKVSGSTNFVAGGKARYLAESGLEHAMYVVQSNPALLPSAYSPGGPYYIDSTGASYVFYGQTTSTPGQYHIYARGTSGGVTIQTEALISRSPNPVIQVRQGLMLNKNTVSLPASVRLNGDLHIKGQLTNLAYINGRASATGTITDTFGRITNGIVQNTTDVAQPELTYGNYNSHYYLDGTRYDSVDCPTDDLASSSSVVNGAAVTPSNPGGVIGLRGHGNNTHITDNVNFTGTLITNCNLYLDGANINLQAMEGFPALVVNGWVYISDTARVTINGSIISNQGFKPTSGAASNSRTTITGAVLCNDGPDSSLGGIQTINYNQGRAMLYDIKQNATGEYKIGIDNWVR